MKLSIDENVYLCCNDKKIQVIAYNRNFKIPTTSSVSCDHRYGGEIIAKHFYSNLHKEVGLIEGMKGSFVSDERSKGFKNFQSRWNSCPKLH